MLLWLEQNIRFHLEAQQRATAATGLDLARNDDSDALFDTRARHMMRTNPELAHIAWLNYGGVTRGAIPGHVSPRQGATSPGAFSEDHFDLARKLDKLILLAAFSGPGRILFELWYSGLSRQRTHLACWSPRTR